MNISIVGPGPDCARDLFLLLTSCQFPVCCAAEVGTSQHTALCGPRREEGEFCILSDDDTQADLTSVLMSHFCHVNTDFPVNMYFHINVTMNYLITE